MRQLGVDPQVVAANGGGAEGLAAAIQRQEDEDEHPEGSDRGGSRSSEV